MPPTLSGPSTAGPSLAAFVDAYYRAAQNRRLEEMLLRQNELAALQSRQTGLGIAAAEREAATAAAIPGMLQAAGGIAPQARQPMAQLPTPPAVLAQALPEAPVPPTMLTPFGPPVTGTTERQLRQGMTPEQYQASLTTPAGTAMRTAIGVEPDVKYERRVQVQDALLEARGRMEEWATKLNDRDVPGAYLAHAAALRALLPTADPAHRERLVAEIRQVTEAVAKLTTDEEEKAAFDEIPALLKAFSRIRTAPDDPTSYEEMQKLAGTIKTKTGRKEALRLLEAAVNLRKPPTPLSQFYTATLAYQAQTPGADFEASMAAVRRADPALTGRALAEMTERRLTPSPDFQLAVTGRVIPAERANAYAIGQAMAYADGLRPDVDLEDFNAKAWEYTQRYLDITHGRSRATEGEQRLLTKIYDRDSIALRDAQANETRLRQLREAAGKNIRSIMKPEELTKLDAAITKAEEITAAARKSAAVSRDALVRATTTLPAEPAPTVEPPPPPPPPPSSPPAAKIRGVNPPPANPTPQQALAEARRLVRLGVAKSNQEAIRLMQQAGWPVK